MLSDDCLPEGLRRQLWQTSRVGCNQESWRQLERLRRDKFAAEHTAVSERGNLRTGHVGTCGSSVWITAQVEHLRDWHSLDQRQDSRVNLAGHAENTTCLLLGGLPKIGDKALSDLSFVCLARDRRASWLLVDGVRPRYNRRSGCTRFPKQS